MIYATLIVLMLVAAAVSYRTGYKRAMDVAEGDFRLVPRDVWPEEDVVMLVNLTQQTVAYPMEIGRPRRVLIVTGQDPPYIVDIVSDDIHPDDDDPHLVN
jgi:hypothetical protein